MSGGFLVNSTAYDAFAITKSDTADIVGPPTRGVYVGGTGDVVAVMQEKGNTVTFTAVPAGSILPIAVTRINATGSTATALVGLR